MYWRKSFCVACEFIILVKTWLFIPNAGNNHHTETQEITNQLIFFTMLRNQIKQLIGSRLCLFENSMLFSIPPFPVNNCRFLTVLEMRNEFWLRLYADAWIPQHRSQQGWMGFKNIKYLLLAKQQGSLERDSISLIQNSSISGRPIKMCDQMGCL